MDMPLEGRRVSTLSSSDEESEAENCDQSLEGTNSQQGNSNEDASDVHVDEQSVMSEHKQASETEAKASEDQGKIPPQASNEAKPSSSILQKVESSPEITELDEHVSSDVTETSMEHYSSFENINETKDIELESPIPYMDEGSKPSSSKTRDARPELPEFDEHDRTTTKDEYVKKSFTCDITLEEEDEQLREYWARALQTSTSTGEIVEEIVRVLKHHQKSHDLLCPVCGSCVTRRVILRKRKRSSLISVDRWYRDSLDDEVEALEQRSSPDVMEVEEEEDKQEYQETEAFGCLACFSLFFDKGRQRWSKIQADVGPDTFNCLPFFFPPYPWGMTQRKRESLGPPEEAPILPEIVQSESLVTEDASTPDVKSDFTCGLGSTLLPDYSWGTMPSITKGLQEATILQETEEIVTRHTLTTDMRPLTTDMRPDYTCGLGSTILPDFPWGTMPPLSKEEAIQSTNQTKDTTWLGTGAVQDVGGSSQSEERTCACGLAPALIPAYPWGVYTKATDYVGPPQAEDTFNEEVRQQEVEGMSQSQREEPSCNCELAPALLPDYPWGSMSRGKENYSVTQFEDNVGVGQAEVEEMSEDLQRKGRSCTCGLVPALLPYHPWSYFAKEKVAAASNVETRIEPEAEVVDVNEPTLEDKGPQCDLVLAVLPNYPWGITTQGEEVIEEAPILGEQGNRRKRKKAFFRNGFHLPALEGAGSTILPSYPWGTCSVKKSVHEQNGGAQISTGTADGDCICGLGSAMLPTFPWGQTHSTDVREDNTRSKILQSYIEQETKIEARITSKTDVYTVTASKTTYPGEQPPKEIKAIKPDRISQTIESVKLDQTVTVLNASVKLDEASSGMKGGTPLPSLPSTGYALLEAGNECLPEKGRLETQPSTGYAYLEELSEGSSSSSLKPAIHPIHSQEDEDGYSGLKIKEIEEDSVRVKYPQETKPASTLHSRPEETLNEDQKHKPQVQPTDMQFPTFQWSVGKVDADDLTTPLLKASAELEGETFISVLKPSLGMVEEAKSDNWLSVFKVSRPPDDSIKAPLLSTVTGYKEEIQEEIHTVAQRPQVQAVAESVISMPPASADPAVGTTAATAVAMASEKKKDADGWDILKSIVYGGLEISIASLGVTSSAAGGNAMTRTVVYMGLATLVSGLIGFYHNVLNLYHYHRDHYTDVVGLTLLLHGTVALISYIVFGALSSLVYAFSYRKTDNRDEKFILCCGVTVVTITALALGKARVSNKRYLRTLFGYLLGGVLAAVIGYLAGEHVSELLEQWGL